MRKLNIFLPIVVLCALVIMLTSCETVFVREGPGKKRGLGPPAHAPAYGLRSKQQTTVQVNVQPGTGAPTEEANTVIVNITNGNGSITPVTLKRSGNVWIGPKGEQYMSIPTAEQLKPIYGM